MNRLRQRLATGTAIAGAAILALGALACASGARINSTQSIPVGLYWLSSEPVEKGAYVMFCPPPIGVFEEARARGYLGAGFCPGGYGYLMKRVLAAKDDAVTITDEGVRVNGELLPHSAPIQADRNRPAAAALSGRALHAGRFGAAADVGRQRHVLRWPLLRPDPPFADQGRDPRSFDLVKSWQAH
jgi:conjugative transfer signal peptidase TraF